MCWTHYSTAQIKTSSVTACNCTQLSSETSGSRMSSGKEFQTVEPATANARLPYWAGDVVQRLQWVTTGRTYSRWRRQVEINFAVCRPSVVDRLFVIIGLCIQLPSDTRRHGAVKFQVSVPTCISHRSNKSLKILELETSNLIPGFVWAMPSRRTNKFTWKWA